jgi:hypothetical protein
LLFNELRNGIDRQDIAGYYEGRVLYGVFGLKNIEILPLLGLRGWKFVVL